MLSSCDEFGGHNDQIKELRAAIDEIAAIIDYYERYGYTKVDSALIRQAIDPILRTHL